MSQFKRKTKSNTVNDLRNELAKLGAKQTGNKEVLQKRLDNWTQHNLNSTLIASVPVSAADKAPFENPRQYEQIENIQKDEIDWLTYDCISQYFAVRTALNSFKEGRKLHVANHLRQFGFAKTSLGDIQLRSRCKAAMKKSTTYSIILELSRDKQISKSTCSCPAGQGNSAACKHVAALLIALESFLATGIIATGVSCTSELQMWHKPPKLQDEEQSSKTVDELFSGCSTPRVNPSTIFTKFAVDAALNIGLNTSFAKLRHCNLIALHNDHDYCGNAFQEYVDTLNSVTQDEIIQIEQQTISQSLNESWFQHRQSRLTASNIHTIITAMETSQRTGQPPSMNPSKRNFHKMSTTQVPSLLWGREKEDVAFQSFCATHPQYQFRKCGLFIDKKRNFLAGSPDGISSCGGTVMEIKCPYSIRADFPAKANCWTGDGNLKKRHPYYSQIQYQMMITGARECFFIVYTLKGIKFCKINYDENFILSSLELIDTYYRNVFCEQFCKHFGMKSQKRQRLSTHAQS